MKSLYLEALMAMHNEVKRGQEDTSMKEATLETINEEFDKRDMEILRLLFDEFKFRVTNLWSLVFKFNMISLILILLPVMHRTWEVSMEVLDIPRLALPVVGMIISVINF